MYRSSEANSKEALDRKPHTFCLCLPSLICTSLSSSPFTNVLFPSSVATSSYESLLRKFRPNLNHNRNCNHNSAANCLLDHRYEPYLFWGFELVLFMQKEYFLWEETVSLGAITLVFYVPGSIEAWIIAALCPKFRRCLGIQDKILEWKNREVHSLYKEDINL